MSICGVMFRISNRLTLRRACWLPKGHEGKHKSFAEVHSRSPARKKP